MAGGKLGICLGSDSNNSRRKLCSALGGRITFDGGCAGFGQTLGFAARPPVAQPDVTAAHTSNNSISDGRGRRTVFFMLRSDCGQLVGLFVFGGTGSDVGRRFCTAICNLFAAICKISRAVAPLAANHESSDEHQ